MSNIKMFEIANSQSLLEELKKVDDNVLKSYDIDKTEWFKAFNEFKLNPEKVYINPNGIFPKMYYVGEYVSSEIFPSLEYIRTEFGGLVTVVKREDNFRKMFENKEYNLVFFSEYNPMALYYFLKNYERIDKKYLYSAFISMYQSISYGFNKIPQKIFDEVFQYAPSTKEIIETLHNDFLEDEENRHDIEIDEDTEFSIYRSQGAKSMALENSYSWSLSLPFVKRYTGFNKGVIYEGKIKVKDMIDYLAGGEKEILAPFSKIYNVKVIK